MENVKHYLGIISSEIKEAFTENKYIILIITAIFIITAFIGFFFRTKPTFHDSSS